MSTNTILLFSLTIDLLVHTVPLLAQSCDSKKVTEFDFALLYSAYKTMQQETLGTCYRKCYDDEECSSINFKMANGHCEHNGVSRKHVPSRYVREDGNVYAEARDLDYGTTKHLAVSSCKRILELNNEAMSGVYWIQLEAQSFPFQVYCDMKTDGGGWTLVYSYQFLISNPFDSTANAMTPIPSWDKYFPTSPTLVSNTVPLSETSYAAMNFTLWKKIGNEFLSMSNILHWFSCKPVVGDLVNMKAGSISCKIVKNVATACLNSVPNEIRVMTCGPALYKGSHYLYYDMSTLTCWPVHDPCGTAAQNHVTSVAVPSGTLYIR